MSLTSRGPRWTASPRLRIQQHRTRMTYIAEEDRSSGNFKAFIISTSTDERTNEESKLHLETFRDAHHKAGDFNPSVEYRKQDHVLTSLRIEAVSICELL